MPVCLKCGWQIIIGPGGCACTQKARHERKMKEAFEMGERLEKLFSKSKKKSAKKK